MTTNETTEKNGSVAWLFLVLIIFGGCILVIAAPYLPLALAEPLKPAAQGAFLGAIAMGLVSFLIRRRGIGAVREVDGSIHLSSPRWHDDLRTAAWVVVLLSCSLQQPAESPRSSVAMFVGGVIIAYDRFMRLRLADPQAKSGSSVTITGDEAIQIGAGSITFLNGAAIETAGGTKRDLIIPRDRLVSVRFTNPPSGGSDVYRTKLLVSYKPSENVALDALESIEVDVADINLSTKVISDALRTKGYAYTDDRTYKND